MRILTALWIITTAFAVGSARAEDPVYFPDAAMKAAVEDTLSIPDPTPSDMLGLTSLYARSRGITDITGIRPEDLI